MKSQNNADDFATEENPRSFPRFLTVEQVAEVLNLSKSKIYQLLNGGKLAFYKIEGTKRISLTDLLNFICECREEKEPPKKKIPHHRLKHIRL